MQHTQTEPTPLYKVNKNAAWKLSSNKI